MLALQRQATQAQAAAPVDTGLSLETIRFRYAISGDSPPWKPLRAFDDGKKVYIQFPGGIAQGELPPLFVIGAQGDGLILPPNLVFRIEWRWMSNSLYNLHKYFARIISQFIPRWDYNVNLEIFKNWFSRNYPIHKPNCHRKII
jgi:hypothetical protein